MVFMFSRPFYNITELRYRNKVILLKYEYIVLMTKIFKVISMLLKVLTSLSPIPLPLNNEGTSASANKIIILIF